LSAIKELANYSAEALYLIPENCGTSGRRLLNEVSLSGITVMVRDAESVTSLSQNQINTIGKLLVDSDYFKTNFPTTSVEVGSDGSVSETFDPPTDAPTPKPSISWQSRFLFWIWLRNYFCKFTGYC
jgi:hypothetical protein